MVRLFPMSHTLVGHTRLSDVPRSLHRLVCMSSVLLQLHPCQNSANLFVQLMSSLAPQAW